MNFGICCGNGMGQAINKQIISRYTEDIWQAQQLFSRLDDDSMFRFELKGPLHIESICKVVLCKMRLATKKCDAFTERKVVYRHGLTSKLARIRTK